jgi:hypothetical protein
LLLKFSKLFLLLSLPFLSYALLGLLFFLFFRKQLVLFLLLALLLL